eukprot:3374977-Rhodomonas_salina.1
MALSLSLSHAAFQGSSLTHDAVSATGHGGRQGQRVAQPACGLQAHVPAAHRPGDQSDPLVSC